MFEPEILFHYYGKLRKTLEDEACKKAAQDFIEILRTPAGDRTYVCLPTSRTDSAIDAFKRILSQEGISITSRRLEDGCELYQFSNHLETAKEKYDVFFLEAGYHSFAKHMEDIRPRGWFSKRTNKLARGGLVLVVLSNRSNFSNENAPGSVEECNRMISIARKEGFQAGILPEPGLSLEKVRQITQEAPAHILDGTHRYEKRIEEELARFAESSQAGALLQLGWRALLSGYGPEKLSLDDFLARLESLDSKISGQYPWKELFEIWTEVLRGIESSRKSTSECLEKLRQRPNSWIDLDTIREIMWKEHEFYVNYAESHRAKLSYPVAFYGYYWALRWQGMMMLGSMFAPLLGTGGGQTQTSAPPGLSWD